jgi:hypothetical protein
VVLDFPLPLSARGRTTVTHGVAVPATSDGGFAKRWRATIGGWPSWAG